MIDISGITEGLEHISLQMGDAQIVGILSGNRGLLVNIASEISTFRAYKRYHGILHDLQLRTHQFPFHLRGTEPNDHFIYTSLYLFHSDLVHCDHQLKQGTKVRDEEAERVYFEIERNLTKISAIRAAYEQSLMTFDAETIVARMRSLKQIVRDTQVFLNGGLIGAATSLRLDELATVGRHIAQVLPTDGKAPVKAFERCLQSAHAELESLADLHDVWQNVENEMIRLADNLELLGQSDGITIRNQFTAEWPGIRDQLMDISARDRGAIWAKGLEGSLSNTDDELAKEADNMSAVKHHFEVCQNLVRKLFYALDEEIIRLCDDLGDLRPLIVKITPVGA